MTKEIQSTNADQRLMRSGSALSIGLCHSLVIRHSSFVIFPKETVCY